MLAALALQQGYPGNKKSLEGKAVEPDEQFKTPRDYPTLTKYQPKINYQNNVAKSCIHCHQIHDAQRQMHRNAGTAIPDKVLYPWPMPAVAGIELDPKTRARVSRIRPGSAAAKAGVKVGDDLQSLGGQPIISPADVQWVLHNTSESARLPMVIKRSGRTALLDLNLAKGWRERTDFSWRTSTWDLRRMVLGGMYLKTLDENGRRKAGIADGKMALIAEHVGQYGEHATAKSAGIQKGDIITGVGDGDSFASEAELIAHLLKNTKSGARVEFIYLREKKRRTAAFPMK
jgi:S1-C subfamily serine protease